MSGSRGRVLQPDQHVDKDREKREVRSAGIRASTHTSGFHRRYRCLAIPVIIDVWPHRQTPRSRRFDIRARGR